MTLSKFPTDDRPSEWIPQFIPISPGDHALTTNLQNMSQRKPGQDIRQNDSFEMLK